MNADRWSVIQTNNGRSWTTKVMRDVFHVTTFNTISKQRGKKMAKRLIESRNDFLVEITWL